ncbi:MAG: hypothetical protein HPY59_15750 [Anaerolineae bacterium]|nr:hypothetical protein [Anaerolineae bacterium]
MTLFQIFFDSYLHPRQAMDALAQRRGVRCGALFVLVRGLLLALFFYLLRTSGTRDLLFIEKALLP